MTSHLAQAGKATAIKEDAEKDLNEALSGPQHAFSPGPWHGNFTDPAESRRSQGPRSTLLRRP